MKHTDAAGTIETRFFFVRLNLLPQLVNERFDTGFQQLLFVSVVQVKRGPSEIRLLRNVLDRDSLVPTFNDQGK
ncbi:hypothetical protein KTT_52980 [Tengunoibacter tsumagoiensis]|uniref:Uncharacterized protein n=1 Tax=Tengunoibacter tsumagoiensis TaxID=2014871 RepID=A0A402A8K5_9CHLR|nr:hypothetical protein KTT_52980 [Tengunoibacter tsumagoiensis]